MVMKKASGWLENGARMGFGFNRGMGHSAINGRMGKGLAAIKKRNAPGRPKAMAFVTRLHPDESASTVRVFIGTRSNRYRRYCQYHGDGAGQTAGSSIHRWDGDGYDVIVQYITSLCLRAPPNSS